MKVLVTGGAGFIGSNLVDLLLQQQHEVVILDNLSSGYAANLQPEAHCIESDVRDFDAVVAAAAHCQVIFHLAASVGNTRSIEHPQTDSEINVLGTLNVLEAARRHAIQRIVFSSSAGIFGELKTIPIAEDHPQEPDSPYGVSKLAAEKHCLAYNKLYGMQNICLRYFNVYGPKQRYDAYGNVIPIFVHRMLHNQTVTIFGDGEQTRDFVNVGDVAQANYKAALAEGVSGVFNIASGSRITINHLVELMTKCHDSGIIVEHGPPRKGDVRHSLADISAAHTAFGYNPVVGLEEGLEVYMAWAKQEML